MGFARVTLLSFSGAPCSRAGASRVARARAVQRPPSLTTLDLYINSTAKTH
jgi:hypothetical protein